MAKEVEGNRASIEAGADLSSYQYYIVKLSAGKVVKATASTDAIVGVLRNEPVLGEAAEVFLRTAAGTGKVIAGGVITAGQRITCDSNGKATALISDKDEVLGIALENAVSGDIFEFMPANAQMVS